MQQVITNRFIVINRSITSIWKFVIAVMICETSGIVSGLLAHSNSDNWFNTLIKPTWNPPAYLFGPVWTILYLLMGIALGLIWKSNAPVTEKKDAILLFAMQLFLNFWWSVFFFKFHSPALAFIDIILLFIVILLTMFSFGPISRLACWLLVPYILWVSFATLLNCHIWSMN